MPTSSYQQRSEPLFNLLAITSASRASSFLAPLSLLDTILSPLAPWVSMLLKTSSSCSFSFSLTLQECASLSPFSSPRSYSLTWCAPESCPLLVVLGVMVSFTTYATCCTLVMAVDIERNLVGLLPWSPFGHRVGDAPLLAGCKAFSWLLSKLSWSVL